MIKVEGRGYNYGVLHVKVEQSASLAQILEQLHIHNAQELINLGSIYLNNQRLMQWPIQNLQPQDYLRVHSTPRRYSTEKIQWDRRVLFSNDNFVILHKPHGIPCHPTVDNMKENCLYQLQENQKQTLYITHRLDVATEGLILFAKSAEAQKYFNELLLQRQVQKHYYCLTQKQISPGLKTHYMEVSPRAPKVVHDYKFENGLLCQLMIMNSTIIPRGNGLSCESISLPSSGHKYLNSIHLLTGRTHQIRAQLAALGAPLLGDHAYGSTQKICIKNQFNEPAPSNTDAIALCSGVLSFKWQEQEFHFTTEMSEVSLEIN